MPKLGDTCVNIGDDYFVLVHVFKFDTIRQEAYWVIDGKRCKKCNTKGQAEEYKKRIEKCNK